MTAVHQHTGPARTKAHTSAVTITPRELGSTLVRVLGRGIVAVMTGKSERTVQRGASGDLAPSAKHEKVLRDAYQVYALLLTVEGDHTVRAWFMGMNPQLEDESPAEALAAGRN